LSVKKEQHTIISLALQRDRVCCLNSAASLNPHVKKALIPDLFGDKSSYLLSIECRDKITAARKEDQFR